MYNPQEKREEDTESRKLSRLYFLPASTNEFSGCAGDLCLPHWESERNTMLESYREAAESCFCLQPEACRRSLKNKYYQIHTTHLLLSKAFMFSHAHHQSLSFCLQKPSASHTWTYYLCKLELMLQTEPKETVKLFANLKLNLYSLQNIENIFKH